MFKRRNVVERQTIETLCNCEDYLLCHNTQYSNLRRSDGNVQHLNIKDQGAGVLSTSVSGHCEWAKEGHAKSRTHIRTSCLPESIMPLRRRKLKSTHLNDRLLLGHKLLLSDDERRRRVKRQTGLLSHSLHAHSDKTWSSRCYYELAINHRGCSRLLTEWITENDDLKDRNSMKTQLTVEETRTYYIT